MSPLIACYIHTGKRLLQLHTNIRSFYCLLSHFYDLNLNFHRVKVYVHRRSLDFFLGSSM